MGFKHKGDNMKSIFSTVAIAGAVLVAAQANAQSWNAEQSEVWTAVSASWDAHTAAGTWSEVLDPAGYGWNTKYPVPTNRTTMAEENRVVGPENTHVWHRLDPLAIAVSGDTAIAYYFARIVENDSDGERQNSTERCADTLIKRDGNWHFLGWMCETTSDDDD
jgi:hypothetical protein